MPETTVSNQCCFKPGQSGNTSGRPKGARHATTLAIEALLDGDAEAITRKAIDAAKAGDMVAIRLVLDRICPPRKTRPIHIELMPISGVSDVAIAQQEVLRASCYLRRLKRSVGFWMPAERRWRRRSLKRG